MKDRNRENFADTFINKADKPGTSARVSAFECPGGMKPTTSIPSIRLAGSVQTELQGAGIFKQA